MEQNNKKSRPQKYRTGDDRSPPGHGDGPCRDAVDGYHDEFNRMPEGFALHEIICDPNDLPIDYRFLEINPSFERITGLKREDIIGKRQKEIFPDEDGAWVQRYGLVALTGKPAHFDVHLKIVNRHYDILAYSPAKGQFAVLFTEITDRTGVKETIRESEERFHLALRNAPVSVAVQDKNLVFEWGYNRPSLNSVEMVGKTDYDLFFPDDADRLVKLKREVLETGQNRQEQIWIGMNGRKICLDLYLEALKDSDGNSTGIGITSIDVTGQKLIEERLKQSETRLLEANTLLEAVTDGAQVIIATQDTEYRYTYFNRAYADEIRRLTGKEITIGMSMIDLFADQPDQLEITLTEWKKVMGGERVNDVIEFGSPGNCRKVYSVLHAPLKDNDGRIIGAGEVAYDISSRILAEEFLRETSQYLENLIDYTNAPIVVWSPDFRITRFNHAFEYLSGRTAEEVTGHSLDILLPKKYIGKSMDLIRQATTGEHWDSVEIPILHKNGSIKTVLWNSAPIYSSDGKTIISSIAQGHDISERKLAETKLIEEIRQRKLAEETLSKTLSLLNAALESTADGILVVDNNGVITDYNQNYLSMWDIPEPLIQKRDSDALYDFISTQVKDPEKFLEQVQESTRHPERESHDIIEFADDRVFERYSKPQKIGKMVVGRVWSFRDVTDRKQAEDTLIASLNEKEVLLREIHHRVKNNLQLITGLLDMTRMRTSDPQTNSILTDMMMKIQAMAQIHTRLYESKQFAKISLERQFKDQIASFSNIYSRKGHDISCDLRSGEIYLSVDQAIPCALVVNEILSNAYKHAFNGRSKGTIMLDAEMKNSNLKIRVRDDGTGMPEGFDFNKANSLGLKLIRTLVEHQLKGSLAIKNRNGTEVIIEFPIPEMDT